MSASVQNSHEAYRLEIDQGQLIVHAFGRWTLATIKPIDRALKADLLALGYGKVKTSGEDYGVDDTEFGGVVFDFKELVRIDTAGLSFSPAPLVAMTACAACGACAMPIRGRKSYSARRQRLPQAWRCSHQNPGMIL